MKGRLFLIVGNSGSGKDSVLAHAVENWKMECNIIVPRRYITRPESPETEKYHSISRETFDEMDGENLFALKWKSYDILYGVHREILDEIDAGNLVIVNVSRQIIDDTKKRFPDTKLIFVWVPLEVSIQRIRDRGRETEAQVQKRIERAKKHQDQPGADFIVKNTGTIEEAGNELIKYLEQFC
ncbi:MAG: hypothetical protein ACTSUE_04415 [Promethearchaeota archaeon]